MASIPTHENSWADQWDYNPDPLPASVTKKSSAGGSAKAKYGKKVEEGFGKTKAVAANGMAKVKVGARFGLHWIKDKFHKTTGKQFDCSYSDRRVSMESTRPNRTSADQGAGSNQDTAPVSDTKASSGEGAKASHTKKVEEGFERIKTAASIGMNRVKIVGHLGINWIKGKYKSSRKQ
ncbi:hypothetical protein ACFX13_021458 [Malus domestica]